MMHKTLLAAALLAATVLLPACGGGSGEDIAETPPVDTGVVPDSAMESPESLVRYAIAMQAVTPENDEPLRMPARDMPLSDTAEAVELD